MIPVRILAVGRDGGANVPAFFALRRTEKRTNKHYNVTCSAGITSRKGVSSLPELRRMSSVSNGQVRPKDWKAYTGISQVGVLLDAAWIISQTDRWALAEFIGVATQQ